MCIDGKSGCAGWQLAAQLVPEASRSRELTRITWSDGIQVKLEVLRRRDFSRLFPCWQQAELPQLKPHFAMALSRATKIKHEMNTAIGTPGVSRLALPLSHLELLVASRERCAIHES